MNIEMLAPIIKPMADKITDAVEKMSDERGKKVKLIIDNHYQLKGKRISEEEYEKLPEDDKKLTSEVKGGLKKTYEMVGAVISYDQYKKMPEEDQKKNVYKLTLIKFVEFGTDVSAKEFQTINFNEILSIL